MLEYTLNDQYISDFIDYTLYNINQTVFDTAEYNFYSYDDFLCAIERAENMENCNNTIPTIQSFIRDRKISINAQLKAAGWEPPKPTNNSSSLAPIVFLNLLLLCIFILA